MSEETLNNSPSERDNTEESHRLLVKDLLEKLSKAESRNDQLEKENANLREAIDNPETSIAEPHPDEAQTTGWCCCAARCHEPLQQLQRAFESMERRIAQCEEFVEQNRMIATKIDNIEREVNEQKTEAAKIRSALNNLEIKVEVRVVVEPATEHEEQQTSSLWRAGANRALNVALGVAIMGLIFGAVYLATFRYLESLGIPDSVIKWFLQKFFQHIKDRFLNFFR